MVCTEGNKIFISGEIVKTTTGHMTEDGPVGPESVTIKCNKLDAEYLRELLLENFENLDPEKWPSCLKNKRSTMTFKSAYTFMCTCVPNKWNSLYELVDEKGQLRGSQIVLCLEVKRDKCVFIRSMRVTGIEYQNLTNFFTKGSALDEF